MLKTYFFIPATNKKFIEKINSIEADEFVLDLEDAIAENQTELALENLSSIENRENYLIRPQLYNSNNKLNDKNLEKLIDIGFHRFFIPKLETQQQLDDLLNIFNYYEVKNLEWYFLVESPKALLNLKDIISSNKYPIKGICFGSQDYTSKMDMTHTTENIYYARQTIVNVAKAYDIEAIDLASTNIKNKETFQEECVYAFNLGFTAKLTLHPLQLNWLNTANYYSQEEISEALKIYKKIKDIDPKNLQAIKIENKIFEKPHIKRVLQIVKYYNKLT